MVFLIVKMEQSGFGATCTLQRPLPCRRPSAAVIVDTALIASGKPS